MRGDSLSFFKPSVFIKAFLVSCVVFSSAFFSSCKDLAGFDPNVNGERTVASNTFSAPTGLTATNGYRQNISLEWNTVSGAKYYEIWCASSKTANDWEKLWETNKNQYAYKEDAGKTLYYRVRAVKSTGVFSAYSSIVKGTSLAKPFIFSGGSGGEYSVNISWFMENSRSINNAEDNYEKLLKFDVGYKLSTSSDDGWKWETVDASSVTSSYLNTYEYTLTNLANSQDYQFKIRAYTEDKDSFEESAAVTTTTMASYTPLAPKFEASEGTSAKAITLTITVPPMVMVSTVTNSSNGENVDVEFPLYFEISRKSESEVEYTTIVPKLYCNGTTSAPDYSNETYTPDREITWIDDDESLIRGEKYEYMLRSYIDVDYAKVICPVGTELTPLASPQPTTGIGWKSAPIFFEIDRSRFENNGLTLSADKQKICSVLFGFNAEWDDLDKADEYKFAIKQNRRSLTSGDSDSGVDDWLKDKGGSYSFETLDEINSREVVFGLPSGLNEDEKGVYSYTLYIVPKDAELVEREWNSVLDFEKADEVRVTDEVELPKAEFEVKGGWKDKVRLEISSFEPDVQYAITRTRYEGEQPTTDVYSFVLNGDASDESGEEIRAWYDTGVEGNCRYSYVLVATASSGVSKEFEPQFADVLGTPKVLFEISKLDYDSFTISFENVLAAEKYEITIGEAGDFADGLTFDINEIADGDYDVGDEAEISFDGSKFTVVVKKPYGYDKADLAGKYVDASVTAFSDVDDDALGSAKVRVLGPALINAAVTGNTDNVITMEWDEVDGASGYLIYRTTYKDADATETESTDTMFYPATKDGVSGSPSLVTGEQISDESILITKSGEKYVLQDTDTPASDDSGFRKNQSRVSWGRPYGYIVLPVKDKSDFSFETDAKTLADGAKVDYTANGALAEAQGSTYGYGMYTAASKSDSISNVTIEWKKPNARNELVPTLYRRAVGTDGAFAKVKGVENLSATDELSGEDLYEAFEYIVKYGETEGSGDVPVPASLLAKLAADIETRYTYSNGRTEPKNRGYAFAAKLSAANDSDNNYYEAINCDWDYSKRGIGPEKSTLYVYNNNIGAEWVGVLSAEGESDFSVIGTDITMKSTDKRGVFSIAPQGIANGSANTTDGMLKVLRDYKHYYKLKIERPNISYEVGNDKDVFAYREITDEELVRAATLAMSIGMENAYNVKSSTWSRAGEPSRTYSENGSVVFKSTSGSPYHVITYTDFSPSVSTKSNTTVTSFLTLNGSLTGTVSKTTDSCPPEYYNSNITIESPIDIYNNAILVFSDLKKTGGKITLTWNQTTTYSDNLTPLPFKPDNYREILGIGVIITDFSGLNDTEEWQ